MNTIAEGVVVKYASVFLEKGEAKLREAFNFTLSKLASLLAAGAITAILVVIGLILFVVPGIIMAIMFALVVPVIMIEQMGALESLSRSRGLVSKRWEKKNLRGPSSYNYSLLRCGFCGWFYKQSLRRCKPCNQRHHNGYFPANFTDSFDVPILLHAH